VLVTAVTPGQELAVTGDVDASTVADLRAALAEALAAGIGDLRLDCSGLHRVDATGLGALMSAHRRAQRLDRRLVLVAVPPALRRLLVVSRLAKVLRVEGDAGRETA